MKNFISKVALVAVFLVICTPAQASKKSDWKKVVGENSIYRVTTFNRMEQTTVLNFDFGLICTKFRNHRSHCFNWKKDDVTAFNFAKTCEEFYTQDICKFYDTHEEKQKVSSSGYYSLTTEGDTLKFRYTVPIGS